MGKKLSNVALYFVLVLGMATTTFAAQGGSIGQGDFSVMKDDKLIDKFSGQNPLKEDAMLVCDGKCMVKSEGISLVAADQAKFAIKNEADTFRLFLREGSVEYVITDQARKIAFHTPDGVYSVAEIMFNAASNPVVRGNVRVTEAGVTEIEVKEGRMVFATADGMKSVGANEKIILAMAAPVAAAPVAAAAVPPVVAGGIFGGGTATMVAGATVVAVAGGATAIVVRNNRSEDPTPKPAPPKPNPPEPAPKPTPKPAPPKPPTPSPSV